MTLRQFRIACWCARIEAVLKNSSKKDEEVDIGNIYKSSVDLLNVYEKRNPKLIGFLRWWYRH